MLKPTSELQSLLSHFYVSLTVLTLANDQLDEQILINLLQSSTSVFLNLCETAAR